MTRPTAPALSSDALRAAQAQPTPFYPLTMPDMHGIFRATLAEAQAIVSTPGFPVPLQSAPGGRWYWNGFDVVRWAQSKAARHIAGLKELFSLPIPGALALRFGGALISLSLIVEDAAAKLFLSCHVRSRDISKISIRSALNRIARSIAQVDNLACCASSA